MPPASPAADSARPRKKKAAKKKSRRKSGTPSRALTTVERPEAGVPRGADNPGLNGGTLIPGAGRGPAPGTGGRPKSVLREKLHDIFQSRTGIIEQIADGVVIHRTRIRITDILPFVKLDCRKCKDPEAGKAAIEGLMNDPVDDCFVTIEGTVSATPKERLAALDLAGKYGPGAVKQIGVEVVRGKVTDTLDYLRQNLTEADFDRVRAGLREIWVVKAA